MLFKRIEKLIAVSVNDVSMMSQSPKRKYDQLITALFALPMSAMRKVLTPSINTTIADVSKYSGLCLLERKIKCLLHMPISGGDKLFKQDYRYVYIS